MPSLSTGRAQGDRKRTQGVGLSRRRCDVQTEGRGHCDVIPEQGHAHDNARDLLRVL